MIPIKSGKPFSAEISAHDLSLLHLPRTEERVPQGLTPAGAASEVSTRQSLWGHLQLARLIAVGKACTSVRSAPQFCWSSSLGPEYVSRSPPPALARVQPILDTAKKHHGSLTLDVGTGGSLEGCLDDLGCLLVHWTEH